MSPFRILDPNSPEHIGRGVCALAVMTKAPQAGRVKTRLVPPLTPEEAAELNKCFLRDTAVSISSARCSGGLRPPNAAGAPLHSGGHRAPLQCCGVAVYTPVGAESAYTDILPADFSLLPQRGDEFGERLYLAVEDLFKFGFEAVCLIGRTRFLFLPLVRDMHDVAREQHIGTVAQLPELGVPGIVPNRFEITEAIFLGDLRQVVPLLHHMISRHCRSSLAKRPSMRRRLISTPTIHRMFTLVTNGERA